MISSIVNSCVRFVRETRSLRVRSRSRTSSTRATHVEAPYATPTCSSRVRAFLISARRAAVRAAHASGSCLENRHRLRNAQPLVIQADGTPDAPREHARGTPRGVPTISTCIRVTPTTSRVRFWAARVSACARSRSSSVVVDPDFVFLRRIVRARRARTACPSRARWASSARLPSRFRLADPIRAPPLPLSLRRSRSRRAAPTDSSPHSVKFLAPRADELDRW